MKMTKTAENQQGDTEALIAIVKEMAASMTGEQSTRHWAEDALWFDIPPFASRGIQPAMQMFDRVFQGFKSCDINILQEDATISGDMGVVCTVQEVNIVLKNGDAKHALVRQTDCFKRRGGSWKLFHEHASVPSGGEWDGKIVTA
ncbi:nuclear transport factor 2 family protein [Mesorhizobium sp. B2-3-11]|nr:nuclear transport factor 2 family protein [Mesorhizobium sp. B2-3-11]